MNPSPTGTAVLVELDPKSWDQFLDNAAKWFDNLLLIQASYRQLAEDTAQKIAEFHIRAYLTELAERAKQHEERIGDLYALIGREPSGIRQTVGSLVGKADQIIADLTDTTGGVAGPWGDLNQLYLACTHSLGAFGVAEQIGLALGIPQITDITFPVQNEKKTDQLLLQEFVLEMAGVAILYKQAF